MVKIRASSRSNRSWGSSNWWHNHQPGTRPCFVNEEVTLIQVLQVRVPLRNGRENHRAFQLDHLAHAGNNYTLKPYLSKSRLYLV